MQLECLSSAQFTGKAAPSGTGLQGGRRRWQAAQADQAGAGGVAQRRLWVGVAPHELPPHPLQVLLAMGQQAAAAVQVCRGGWRELVCRAAGALRRAEEGPQTGRSNAAWRSTRVQPAIQWARTCARAPHRSWPARRLPRWARSSHEPPASPAARQTGQTGQAARGQAAAGMPSVEQRCSGSDLALRQHRWHSDGQTAEY